MSCRRTDVPDAVSSPAASLLRLLPFAVGAANCSRTAPTAADNCAGYSAAGGQAKARMSCADATATQSTSRAAAEEHNGANACWVIDLNKLYNKFTNFYLICSSFLDEVPILGKWRRNRDKPDPMGKWSGGERDWMRWYREEMQICWMMEWDEEKVGENIQSSPVPNALPHFFHF